MYSTWDIHETVTGLVENREMTPHTFVAFADVHLDRRFAWADRRAATKRRLAIRRSLAAIVELAEQVDATALLCAGDLFENQDFTPDTAAFVADLFDCGRPVLFAPGNHDFWSADSPYARVDWSSNVHVFREPGFTPVALGDDLVIWGAAHLSPTGTPNFFDAFDPAQLVAHSEQPRVNHLTLFHGSERRGLALQGDTKVGHAPFDAADIEQAGFDYAFVGHYHRSFIGSRHCYPGNPDPLEFGEDSPRGAAVVVLGDDGSVDCRIHPVAQTECFSVQVDLSACRSQTDVVDATADVLRPLAGFVRVDLVGALDPAVAVSVPDVRAGLPAVALDGIDDLLIRTDGLRRRYDLDALMNEPFSVRARFLDLVSSSEDLDGDDRDLIIEMGLRAFDGQTDLEVI